MPGIINNLKLFKANLVDVKNEYKTVYDISRSGDGLGSTKFASRFKGAFSAFKTARTGLTSADIQALKDYNAQLDLGVSKQTAFYRTLLNASEGAQEIAASAKYGKVNLDNLRTSSDNLKASLIGSKVAAAAFNAAITMGISFAISKFIELVNWAKSYHDNMQKDAEAAAEKAKQRVSNLSNEQNSLQSLIEKYKELAKNGVVDISDRLQAKDIQNQITQLVGAQADNLDLVNGKLDEQLKKLNDIYGVQQDNSTSAYRRAYDTAVESITKSQYGDWNWVQKLANDWGGGGSESIYIADTYTESTFSDTVKRINDLYEKLSIKDAEATGTFNDFILRLPDKIGDRLDALDAAIKALESQPNYKENKIWEKLNDYYDEMRDKIHSAEKSMLDLLNNITNKSISEEDGKDFNSVEDYIKYRNDIIEKITSDEDVKEAIDKGLLSKETVSKQVDAYLSTLDHFKNYYNEWYEKFGSDVIKGINDIKNQFNEAVGATGTIMQMPTLNQIINGQSDGSQSSTTQPTKEQIEALKKAKEFAAWIDNLSFKDKELVYKISVDTDTATWDLEEWQTQLDSARQQAIEAGKYEVISLSSIFSEKGDSEDKSFSERIKTYRENINSLIEALTKYRNGELDADSYHGLIEKFPQLAGHTKDLDVAIASLMDDMDSDMVSDFSTQFGKLETQEDIDALKEYESQVLSTRKQNSAFAKSYGEIYDKIEAVRHQAERYNSLINGNVDYNKRPLVSPEKMREYYPEFDGEIATTYSQYTTIGEGDFLYTIDITPILEDGTVLSQEALDEYVGKLVTDKGLDSLLASDTENLIINVQPGDYDEKYWDEYQEKLGAVKETHWELIKQLQDELG